MHGNATYPVKNIFNYENAVDCDNHMLKDEQVHKPCKEKWNIYIYIYFTEICVCVYIYIYPIYISLLIL